jgi:glycosyltransferase involved in cell wall biosynthesis
MRLVVVIPVHNEADNLPVVLKELHESGSSADVLVVDDGSTDATPDLLEGLGVLWLRVHQQVGVGGAVRAGLRYASMLGFDTVVRLDGDGQHPPDQIATVLQPIVAGDADAVLGSRHLATARSPGGLIRRLMQRILAACMSMLSGYRITDPTSGYWAFGPAAVRLLAHHHPTGYPEPELLLFLRRNGLRIVEVPIVMRERLRGRSSLTVLKITLAIGRVLLAMLIVPLRQPVRLPQTK